MNRRATFDRALRRSPAQPIFRRESARRLAVLCYHGIDDPVRFAEQIDYVASRMRPVSLADAEAAIHHGRPLPERAVLLTFDDGERSLLEVGLPIMRARGVPGVSYIVAGVLGTNTPFWWVEVAELVAAGGRTVAVDSQVPDDVVQALKRVPNDARLRAIDEVRESAGRAGTPVPQMRPEELALLEAAGIDIGNHTLTHPCLNRCDDQTIARELGEADRILFEALGGPRRTIAYPNGDWDDRVLRAAHDLGCRTAFALNGRSSRYPAPNALTVHRFTVDSRMSLDRFAVVTSGLLPAVLRARQRLKAVPTGGRRLTSSR